MALALWPTSFVLCAYYSEGLFIAATALGLWADRRDRPAPALLACFLAPLTRTVGIAFAPVLAGALVAARTPRTRSAPATSCGARRRRWRYRSCRASRRVIRWPGCTRSRPGAGACPRLGGGGGCAGRGRRGAAPDRATEYALNLIAVAVASAGAVVVVRWWRQGTMPTSAAAWTVAAIVLPLCTVMISSQIRFVMAAWPAAAAFAYRGRGAGVLRLCAGAVGIALSVLLVRRWANDIWVA